MDPAQQPAPGHPAYMPLTPQMMYANPRASISNFVAHPRAHLTGGYDAVPEWARLKKCALAHIVVEIVCCVLGLLTFLYGGLFGLVAIVGCSVVICDCCCGCCQSPGKAQAYTTMSLVCAALGCLSIHFIAEDLAWCQENNGEREYHRGNYKIEADCRGSTVHDELKAAMAFTVIAVVSRGVGGYVGIQARKALVRKDAELGAAALYTTPYHPTPYAAPMMMMPSPMYAGEAPPVLPAGAAFAPPMHAPPVFVPVHSTAAMPAPVNSPLVGIATPQPPENAV